MSKFKLLNLANLIRFHFRTLDLLYEREIAEKQQLNKLTTQ
jgi:hypothetical protein